MLFADINLFTIFTAGLFVGGLSCIAVQGGLLTAALAQRESEHLAKHAKNGKILPILSFLAAKLVVYTLFGALLGWFGSLFQLSLQMQIILQSVVVLFIIGTALSLVKAHPVCRYFVIQPPAFIFTMIKNRSKGGDIFAPALLGAFTLFIPCGTTQAIMALAIGSGNPFIGALILFTFTLGTSPVFFVLGYFTMKLGDVLQKHFMKVAAIGLIFLALVNLEGVLNLAGVRYTQTRILREVFCIISYCPLQGRALVPVTEQTITITSNGYTPRLFAVPRGAKVTITLTNVNAINCAQAFTMPSLNLQKIVAPNETKTFSFTAPQSTGSIPFMCSRGNYVGRIEVF